MSFVLDSHSKTISITLNYSQSITITKTQAKTLLDFTWEISVIKGVLEMCM